MAQSHSGPVERLRSADIFTLAASFGLLAGLLEGGGLFFLQKGPWAGETINTFFVPRAILYVSPLTDLALFVAIAFLTAAIFRLTRLPSRDLTLFFVVMFLLVFDWLSLALDRVLDPAIIVILSAGVSAALARGCRIHAARIVQFSRRSLPVLAIAVVLLVCGVEFRRMRVREGAVADWPQPPKGAPNVLIIVMDTVRADHLSALGYERNTSPNLDRLAAQGVLFENAFSTSSWTLPAHASLLTGRFPFEHGAEVMAYDGRYPTLAEEFRRRGYRTGAFSANTFFFIPQNGFGTGFLHFEGLFSTLTDALIRPFYGRQLVSLYAEASYSDLPGRRPADQINSDFLRWLPQDGARPFFVVLNYFDAHAPYLPPAPFRSRFSSKPDPGGILNYIADREKLDRPDDTRDERDAYDGAIAFEDAEIGALLVSLRDLHLSDNTMVVILADHGEFFGEHGLFMHRNALYLEGIRVPLFLLWPGHLPAGVRITTPVSIASLPATFMQLLPRPGQTEFPGPSLAALWNGNAPDAESPFILSELVSRAPSASGGAPPRTESLLTSQWHFLFTRGQQPQLFDWRADPREQRNLAQSSEGRQVTARMLSCINDHLSLIRRPDCGLSAIPSPELATGFAAAEPAP
jgi:arylsulfatase A-like enzyme